ncbi:uncharacterized protein CTRU02_209994 [Colletotrichum truncatum]|uniref:Uncharacterized protein n=1 Tax=Colletotrichum truncatum TaxID=5467 RepID=A0ACC3YTX4_COLTU|nr:uncharacterized protein CTRU02_02569 [Colletotrichum truncatum]KAF6798595.1 hypothetical protein CTRU02_02569 [Colletotrichum truncatum]
MHQQALRSAGSRIKPDVVAVKTCIRTFSTTQLRAADPSNTSSNEKGAAPRQPTGRERSRAAASEIGQLLRGGSNAKPLSSGGPNAAAAPAKPKVIDIKTLPTRGGSNFVKVPSSFRGRGGGAGLGRGGRPGLQSGRGGFAARGRGGSARGGRGGRGGGGGGGRPPRRRRDGEEDPRERKDRAEEWERFYRPETAEEHAWYQGRDHGVAEAFKPSMTAESLLGFTPALALGQSVTAKESSVLLKLRDVAGNASYSPDSWQLAEHVAKDLAYKGNGVHFFSSIEEKTHFLKTIKEMPEDKMSSYVKAIREAKLEEGAEKAVREYIVERTIKGKHQAPQSVAVGKEPAKMAAQGIIHNSSYHLDDSKKFDAKIASLVARAKSAAAAAAAPPPAKGKAAKAAKA